jgi:hypothetical protein
VWEAKLAEEQPRGLHFFDGRDLPSKLEELHAHVVRVEDECIVEARDLSQMVIEIFNALVNLQMLPI